MTSVYSQTRWSLADLFPAVSSPELTTTLEQLEVETGAFEARRPELASDIPLDRFLAIIRELEHINHLAYRVYSFASLSFAADTQDQVAQTFLGRVRQIMAGLENRTLFFSLWWKDLDDENAGRLLAGAGDYHYWLEEMRHFKPHTLSEAEEKVVNLKNTTGAGALRNLYDSITNRYVYQVPVDGVVKEMTRGELMSLVRTADPDVRAAAYQELYRVYAADAPILGQIYQSLVWDWRNEQVDLRRFTSPLSARNLTNDIPDQVVNTLLDACQRNAPIFQRFFRLKAGLLGLQRLRRYDVYAPIASTEKTYDFGVAAEMVLDAFQRFDSGLAGQARQVFEVNHLDSEVRKGKRSGAFCATVTPDLVPWVLVNFQGRPDDIATLAHELGHAVHALLASHHSLWKVTVWGNHSASQYPDITHATVAGRPAIEVVGYPAWHPETFIPTVAKRGAAIIDARGASSAASAANAAIDHVHDWVLGTRAGDWVSSGVTSDGSYGIPDGIISGFPCTSTGGDWQIVPGLDIDDFSRARIDASVAELIEERDAVKALGLL